MELQRSGPAFAGVDRVFVALVAVIDRTVRPASSSNALMTISSQ
jgi:hypothetical protein